MTCDCSAIRDRLEQALGNLVDNALRYGGGEVRLRASADRARRRAARRGRGPGFPPDFVDQAFERFTRADPGRGGRGAGLGLSIVRTIARAHGGDAHVANRPAVEPTSGSSFQIGHRGSLVRRRSVATSR